MTIVAIASIKGAPGVTTLSCLVAASWPVEHRVVLVEGDPSGGDLAARFGLSTRHGWSSFAAASRRLEGIEPIGAHVQQLPGGLEVLVGARSADPGEDRRTISTLLSSAGTPEDETVDVIADIGRLPPGERGVELWLERSTSVVIVLRRDAPSILHVRDRMPMVRSRCGGRLGLVVVGPGLFPKREIERFTEVPVLAELPDDPHAAQVAGGDPGGASRLKRSLLVLSAKRLATALSGEDLTQPPDEYGGLEGREAADPPVWAARQPEGQQLTGKRPRQRWALVARAAGLKPRFESSPDQPIGIPADDHSEPPVEQAVGSPAEQRGDPRDGAFQAPSKARKGAPLARVEASREPDDPAGIRAARMRGAEGSPVRDIIASAIRERVAEDLASPEAAVLAGDDRREFARRQIFAHLDLLTAAEETWRPAEGASRQMVQEDEQRLAQAVLDALFGMGRLQSLIDDPDIENIDINGCDRVWVTYADGSKHMMEPVADSDEELIDLVRSAASRFGLSERRFDLARPELDLRLPDGSRLSALMAVAARPAVSVRRHRFSDLSLSDLTRLGSIDEGLEGLLRSAVRARKNIVVSGAMNSGKTTLLRALASEIPARERLVTIEQAFELGLDTASHRHPDMVALEARPANMEGAGQISVADLVRRALRMNADRVIVGEVLGDEVLPMLNAMSQGRSGSMCSIHADSSASVFRRIASYAVQSPERLPLEASNLLLAGAIHLVVHLDSEMHDPLDRSDAGSDWIHAEPRDRSRRPADGYEAAGSEDDDLGGVPGLDPWQEHPEFHAGMARDRFVSSVREVVDAEGVQVVSNEVYRPGPDRRAVPASPLRPETLRELRLFGYEPPHPDILSALV